MTLLVVAFAPGVFFCLYVYYRDRYEPENPWTVLRIFLWGMASVAPAAAIESWLAPGPETLASGHLTTALEFLLVIGPIEELCKFAPVRWRIYPTDEFNEPMDGIVYSTASAMGFASLENLLYLLQEGLEAAPVRTFLAVPGHLFFSGIWGYHLGLAKFQTQRSHNVALSLVMASALHGVYNLLVVSQVGLALLAVPLMAFLGGLFLREIDQALERSPMKPASEGGPGCDTVVGCPTCGAPTSVTWDECRHCGLLLPPRGSDEVGRDS